MVVTRVEAVTKTKYKVYVDGQFAFILYKGELSRFHIAEDQELSQESYEKIRTEVILKRAKLRAMHLLNDMWRTEAQLREKLTRNEYPADIVEAAISYVKSFGYINDYEYARSFIESRKERKSRREIRENTTPEEKKKIMAYLVRKGFGYDDIRRTMQIYECEMYS